MPKLTIDIEARLATFQDSLDQVKRSTDGLVNNIESRFGGLTAVFGTLATALSAVKLTEFVRDAIDAADELSKVSQRIGVTVESLSALQYAAKLSDVSNEALADGLKKLSINAQEAARSGGDTAAAFRAIGISQQELAALTPDQLLRRVADAYAKLEDGAGKTANAVKIGGKSFNDLIPLLNAGSKGLDEAAQEAAGFGRIISSDTAKAAEAFNDNLTRMGELTKGFAADLAQRALPALQKFTEEAVEGVKIFGSLGGALINLGTINPFKSLAENLATSRKEVERLQSVLKNLPPQATNLRESIAGDLASEQRRLEFLKFQQRRGIAGAGAGGLDARDLALAQADRRGSLTVTPDASGGGGDSSDPYATGTERMGRRWAQAQFDQFAELSKRAKQYQAELLRTFEQGNETDAKAVEDFAAKVNALLAGTKSGQTAAVNADLLVLNDALVLGKINADQYEEAFKLIEERFAKINGVSSDVAKTVSEDWRSAFKDLEFAVQGWGRGFTEEVLNVVKTGRLNFSKLVDSILSDLARLVIQRTITKPIFDAIGGALGQGFGSLFKGSSTPSAGIGAGAGQGLQIKGYAAGGAFPGGVPMIVGERGPELMVPRSAGTIIPNGGFGGRVTQVFNIAPGVDAGVIYRAAQMGASMAKSDIARGMRIGEMG